MKKIFYLLCITFLMLQSCYSEDDTNSNDGSTSTAPKIIGKWEYFQYGTFPSGTIITGNESLMNYQQECPSKKDYIEFMSNGTCEGVYYYVEGNNCKEQVYYGTWDIADSYLTINLDTEGEVTYDILSLTNAILKFKSNNYSPQGKIEEIVVNSFKKI